MHGAYQKDSTAARMRSMEEKRGDAQKCIHCSGTVKESLSETAIIIM